MNDNPVRLSSGWPQLDQLLRGILPGDNIVWSVDAIEDYARLVTPYAEAAQGRRLVYFRFAGHPPVLPADTAAEMHVLDPRAGFGPFVSRLHDVIDATGRGAYYVFDSLTDLAETWCSDAMLANFFLLTCPHLYDLETVAYFALRRGAHAPEALEVILDTTQVFVEILKYDHHTYLRLRKAQRRSASTLAMLHAWDGSRLEPVVSSVTVAEVLTHAEPAGPLDAAPATPTVAPTFDRFCRSVIAGGERIAEMLRRYLTREDLQAVQRRMVGTGRIGGKAIGLLLARAILRRDRPPLTALLEPHDSFFVGADVFYTFLVHNGIWWLRTPSPDTDHMLREAALVRRRILSGSFHDRVVRQFAMLVDYFGNAPFIVRSSSLLEDNYGNAFAGKYDSMFCPNQGPREQRLADFLTAVHQVYASTMSERALRYRAARGLLDQDEQMALLVMRVSGSLFGHRFFPPIAGVALSFNPYAWHPEIDPRAGVVRLVLGLGTRAVNRVDDDYTRLVALNAPLRRPEANFEELAQYAQRHADFIDLEANQVVTSPVSALLTESSPLLPLHLFLVEPQPGSSSKVPILTFDPLFTETPLARDLRDMLRTLEDAYGCPVDTEFTVNFPPGESYRINLLQCRPLEGAEPEGLTGPWPEIPATDLLIEAADAVIGTSRLWDVPWLIYITPAGYSELTETQRHSVARLLGTLTAALRRQRGGPGVLLGPGRWGSTNAFLGLPVNFSEIQSAGAIFEILIMHAHLIPDASLGTHFFNDLVERGILYAALRPDLPPNALNEPLIRQIPNALTSLLPDAHRWISLVHVALGQDLPAPYRRVRLAADARRQRAVCWLARD